MNTWEFCGMYGDDNDTVYIKTMPADLSVNYQAAIRAAYRNKNELHAFPLGYELSSLGLVREIGNAWNKCLMWAPQVHEWMNQSDTNEAVGEGLRDQYT